MRIMKKRKPAVYPQLACWELKKLWQMRAFRGFLLCGLILNLLLVSASRQELSYTAYVREAGEAAGTRMGPAFDKKAAQLADSQEKQQLISETSGARDIFQEYSCQGAAQDYICAYKITGWLADSLWQKYKKQEPQIQRLAAQQASMDLGAAGMTKPLFELLFEKLCRAILTEGLFLAVFAALYVCGCARADGTWQTVYASRRGRLVQREKFLAGLLYALAAYAVTAAVSCTAFACTWRLGGIWNTNMSTQFYYIQAMGIRLPFVPWTSFTLKSYLAAVLALGTAVVLLFYAAGYLAGLLCTNSYGGFLVLFLAGALNFLIVLLAGNSMRWGIYEAAMWTPFLLWWQQPQWFSDMGINAIVPWQECRTAGVCMGASVILLYAGFWYFARKDLK